jgi:hypothetical protein
MKPELVAVTLIFLIIAAGAVFLWPQENDPAVMVEALAGPQPDGAAARGEGR